MVLAQKLAPMSMTKPLFQAKGLVYQGACEFYERTVPGGTLAVCAHLRERGETDAAELLGSRLTPGSWYDILPISTISAAAARLRNMTHGQIVRENAVWVAERDLQGVYRVLLHIASVKATAMRLPGLSMRYFDFGAAADSNMLSETLMESHRLGIPASLAPWFVFATEGFVPVALRMSGAKKVFVRSGSPRPDGTRDGVPLVKIRFEIGWE